MRKPGFTLLELLIALAILGLLLTAVLGFTASTGRVERGARARALLAEDLSLAATVLAREAYLAGYRVQGEGASLAGGRLLFRFLCEKSEEGEEGKKGMEAYCSQGSMGKVRTVGYEVRGGTLYWGTCHDPGCAPAINNPVMDGVEAFLFAYQAGGGWTASPVTVSLGAGGATPRVQALAFYLLARAPVRTGAPAFTPGSAVEWPPGLRSVFPLPTPPADGHPRAERLVVVQTPNLAR